MEKEILNILVDFENGELTLLQAHTKLLVIFSVVRGGDKDSQFVQHVEKYFDYTNVNITPNTPTEPLATEVRDTVAARGHIHKWHKTLDGETICYMCGETQITDVRKSSEGQL
jgi:hypothetical protein